MNIQSSIDLWMTTNKTGNTMNSLGGESCDHQHAGEGYRKDIDILKAEIKDLKEELTLTKHALSNANKALGGVRKHVTAVDMRPGDQDSEGGKSNGEG